jgi:hypothetical protein
MHYRLIVFTTLCFNFWINPAFGNEGESPGLRTQVGDYFKSFFSSPSDTKPTGNNAANKEAEDGETVKTDSTIETKEPKDNKSVQEVSEAKTPLQAEPTDNNAATEGPQVDKTVKTDSTIETKEPKDNKSVEEVSEAKTPSEAKPTDNNAATEGPHVNKTVKVATPTESSEGIKPRDGNTEANELAASSPGPKPIDRPPLANSNNKKDPGCEFIGAHAIADWLNSINIGSFFNYASRHVLRNDECFVILDSPQSLTIWMEPYGFNAHYCSPTKSKNVDLTLSSIGTSLGASYTLLDELHLGGGVGYFHSTFDSKGEDAHVNGVYFGPSVEYLFSEGSVGFMIMGIGNFYEGQRETGQECKSLRYSDQSWDLDMRLEAEYDLHPPADFFIKDLTLHPFVRIDYLTVFERGSHQKESFDLKDRHSSFFYSKLSMRLEKMVFCNKTGFLTSNVDIGWVNMTPLSSDAFEWRAKEKDKIVNLTTESKNQCALGLEFVGVYHNGLLVGIGYQAAIGASSLMQTGRARIEWNW